MDMDFACIVGSSAYLSRQLELRWFFQWENNAVHSSKHSAAISSSDPQSLEQRTPVQHGRLVRKRYHSMPFLRRNLVSQGSGGRRSSRTTGSQTCMRKRARPSLALHCDGMKASSDNTAAVALANPQPNNHPKRAQPSLSTIQSNEVTRRCNGQGEPMSINGSKTIPDASSALLLPVTCRGFTKTSAVLLPGASFALLKSNVQLGSEINTAQSHTQAPPAYFHYLFMQPNNVPATIVQEIDGRICPLCNFDGKNNEGLLIHCGIYHGILQGIHQQHDNSCENRENNFDCAYFEAALGEEGQLHVIVRGIPTRSTHLRSTNCNHDKFAYIRPRFCISQNNSRSSIEQQLRIPFLGRRHDKVASLDSVTRSKRLLALQSSDAPTSVISAYLPSDTVPIRQYYHSHTSLPMTNDDWMGDSDDDIDDNWVQEMSSELLNEFEDVTAEEKQFLTLWNKFIKSNHVIGDRDMPDKCLAFVFTHRNKLINAGLRLQLLLHLFHLWDSGVISSNRIRQCMALFDGTTSVSIGNKSK